MITEKIKEMNLKEKEFLNSLSKKQFEKYINSKVLKSEIEREIKKHTKEKKFNTMIKDYLFKEAKGIFILKREIKISESNLLKLAGDFNLYIDILTELKGGINKNE